MQELDGILEEVIIKVLVEVQKEVHADFPVVNDLVGDDSQIFNMSIVVFSRNEGVGVPAREEVVVFVAADHPFVFSNDFLSSVVSVVDRSLKGLSFFVSEGVEH